MQQYPEETRQNSCKVMVDHIAHSRDIADDKRKISMLKALSGKMLEIIICYVFSVE